MGFVKKLNESYIKYIDNILEITHGKQKEYYSYIKNNIKVVKIEPTHEVLGVSKETITEWVDKYAQSTKQCYIDAARIAMDFDVCYVEGIFLLYKTIPIEHAFNEHNGRYFDITSEYVSKAFNPEDEYTTWFSLNVEELRKVMIDAGKYGPYNYNHIIKNIKK